MGLIYAWASVVISGAGRRRDRREVRWPSGRWGMQFGIPFSSVGLTVLVHLVALNCSAFLKSRWRGRALTRPETLASKSGTAGAFFNGGLATGAATPCTAPFLSIRSASHRAKRGVHRADLSLRRSRLAAPYVLLSWNPAWLKFLPARAWMEKSNRHGLPMLATTAWLFNSPQAAMAKCFVARPVPCPPAFAAWISASSFQRGRKRRGIALVLTLFFDWRLCYALEGAVAAGATVADTLRPVR